jgi:hypothetical protein
VHAGFLFASEYPSETAEWHTTSNYVVVLQVPDLPSLIDRFARLPEHAQRVLNTEPDVNDEATSFAVLGADAGRVLSDLPLCLKEAVMA